MKERKRSRSRSRSRDRRGEDRRRREREEREREEKERAQRERDAEQAKRDDARRAEKMKEELQMKVDLARRDDCTVIVMSLHPRAEEKEVYQYFSKTCGKVRDVQIIRDPRSGKSKGISYVEFYLPESVYKALACTGELIMKHPIRVQASQADKNRASEAAKVASALGVGGQLAGADVPMRICVGNLVGPLEKVTDNDLSKWFSAFGELEFTEIAQCPYTEKCKGYAYVQFRKSMDAKEAIAGMDLFEIAGVKINVGYSQTVHAPGANTAIGAHLGAGPATPLFNPGA